MNKNIKNICVKYIMNEANIEELELLEIWLENPKNKQLFQNYLKINYAMDMNMSPIDTERAKKEYLQKIRADKQIFKRRKLFKRVRYVAAAILVVAFVSTYLLKNTFLNRQIEISSPIIVNNQIEPGSDKATLVLETGEIVALEKGSQFQTKNAISNGEEITYVNNASKELVYNYLTIPRGGQFQLTLSDGTRVWLNSETQLKYPVSFTDGESRKVELVYGEAYFEVSHSTEHKGSDFRVIHNQQEVQVLGTEFNIKAYKEETNIYTTLVQGRVAVSFENQNKILKPGEQLNLNTNTKIANISMVDVYDQISWKKGVFSFKRKSLKEIMQVLSRWYDMDVDFENKDLESVGFSGALGKEQSIDEILEIIKDFGVIKNYEINTKKVILK